MRRVRELLHREEPQETPCPRCGVPAPPGATECSACGWDVRDVYQDPLKESGEGAVTSDRRDP